MQLEFAHKEDDILKRTFGFKCLFLERPIIKFSNR